MLLNSALPSCCPPLPEQESGTAPRANKRVQLRWTASETMPACDQCLPCVVSFLTGMFCSLMTVCGGVWGLLGRARREEKRRRMVGPPLLPSSRATRTESTGQHTARRGGGYAGRGVQEVGARRAGGCGTTVPAGSRNCGHGTKLQNNSRRALTATPELRMDCTDVAC
jgi:hypothetical protein